MLSSNSAELKSAEAELFSHLSTPTRVMWYSAKADNNMRTKVLIIGNGSIASRHAELLHKSGKEVYIYPHRAGLELPEFAKPHIDLDDVKQFSAAFICTPTCLHLHYTQQLLQKKLPLFIEKPLSDKVDSQVINLLKNAKSKHVFCMVGFNMRFLPIVETITRLLKENKLGKILAADLYVGQYLPDWRPTKKYEGSYSASYKKGGGVALDLIHEVDLAFHWFGAISKPKIISYKLSDLKTDVEDYVHISSTKPPAITITLDTLNKVKTRRYRIIGTQGSIFCDIYRKYAVFTTLEGKQTEYLSPADFDTQQSFRQEHDFLFKAIESHKFLLLNERFWGLDALRLCVKARKYVSRS